MTYSPDLRKRVMDFYNQGHTQKETINTFQVSKSSLNNWICLFNETGSLDKKERKSSPSKFDSEKLHQFIEENPFVMLKEIAEHFGGTVSGAHDALKREKITLKKRHLPIKNETN